MRRPRGLALVAAALAGLIGASGASAQSGPAERRHGTGADTPAAEDIKDLPVAELTRAYIPEAISLAERFPLPGDQEKTQTCVAWATAYAARSYYNGVLSSAPGRPEGSQIASPAYLHNLMYSRFLSQRVPGRPCDKVGSNIILAMALLKEHGALSEQDYSIKQLCEPRPSLDAGRAARNRIADLKVVAYRPVDARDAGLAVPVNLDRVRLQLAAGHPIVFGMTVGPTFERLAPGTVYASTVAELRESDASGHAMVVVGYDDRRQAFHVLNSWGPKWADSGYGWVSYRSFLADVTNAFTMDVAGVTPPRPVPTRPPSTEPPRPPEVASMQCADVRRESVQDRSKALRYAGFVANRKDKETIDDIVDDIRFAGNVDVENAVAVRPWPVCEALLTLKEPLLAPSRPTLSIVGGKPAREDARGRPVASDAVVLKVANPFSIRIAASDVPSYLYAVYIEDDGTVVNLIPRRGPMRRQTMPGEQVVLGDGQQGPATFRATRPKGEGHEAVVVIAARAPIQELEDEEKPDSAIYYRVSAKSDRGAGPPDRLFLSLLRNITLQRAEPNMLPREVSAAVVHIKIEE